ACRHGRHRMIGEADQSTRGVTHVATVRTVQLEGKMSDPQAESVLERDSGMPASTWRLRSDAWEFLRFAVKRLVYGDGSEVSEALASDGEIRRSLRTLETLEMYWAGFGSRYVRSIGELLDDGKFQLALDRIGRVVNRLRTAGTPEEATNLAIEED